MLEQIQKIVSEQKTDVMIVSGDVYHTATPSTSVQKMFSNAIVNMYKANPDMYTVITAGNHDSASRHEIFQEPWQALNVYAVGTVSKDDLDEHIVEIPGKGFIVAVPYINERLIPDGFFQSLLDRAQELNEGKGLPIVMCAHTTVKGSDIAGHDQSTADKVGGLEPVEIASKGKGYDYLAPGHIHHAQFIHGTDHRVRYCGTPLAVSFDEAYSHSVSIVEIGKHGDAPTVSTIEIENPHPLVSIPAKTFGKWEDVLNEFRNYPDDIPSYIRLNVELDGDMLPTTSQNDAQAVAKNKKCRFCIINSRRKSASGEKGPGTFTVQEFKTTDALDVARMYAKDKNITFTDEMTELFKFVQDAVQESDRNA